METLILSSIMGLGIVFTLSRAIPWRFLMRHHIWFDVGFTVVMPLLFAGSFQGMALACLSGIVVSVSLALLRLLTPSR